VADLHQGDVLHQGYGARMRNLCGCSQRRLTGRKIGDRVPESETPETGRHSLSHLAGGKRSCQKSYEVIHPLWLF